MADAVEQSGSSGSTPDSPPPPPVPASDPHLFSRSSPPQDASSPRLASLTDDIFDLSPLSALQMLAASVEALVRLTGDIPPTPPPPDAGGPTNMRGMQAEKESIVRTLSANSLAKLREKAQREDAARQRKEEEQQQQQQIQREHAFANPTTGSRNTPPREDSDASNSHSPSPKSQARLPPTPPATITKPTAVEIDGVHLRASSPSRGSSGSEAQSPPVQLSADGVPILVVPPAEPYIVIGANSQPLNLQHSAIARKFYCKKAPPISISEYLLRLHRFCPMSTGVYLATSLYIYRLAVAEKAIAVTRRNVHRLLLAGLRVAMKALEDLSYKHNKIALVGGVTEAELSRLEINFCFLAGFELSVRAEEMRHHWMLMKSGRAVGALDHDGTAAVLASMDAGRVALKAKVVAVAPVHG